MKNIFSPVIHIMNFMRFPQKMMVMSAVLLIPLAVVLPFLISDLYATQQVIKERREGVELIYSIGDLIRKIQLHRGSANAYLKGNSGFKNRLPGLVVDIENGFASVERTRYQFIDKQIQSVILNGIHSQWQKLNNDYNALPVDVVFDRHTEIIGSLLNLILRVGASGSAAEEFSSKLYFVDIFLVNEIYRLTEYIGQARGKGAGFLASADLVPDKKNELISLVGLIQSKYESITRMVQNIYMDNPRLLKAIDDNYHALGDNVNHFIDVYRSNILSDSGKASDTHFFSDGTKSIDSVIHFYEALIPVLNEEFDKQERLSNGRMYMYVALVVVSLLSAIYLFYGFYYSVLLSINSLIKEADEISGGHLKERIAINTRDEFSHVMERFNHMADKLEKVDKARAMAKTGMLKAKIQADSANKAKSEFISRMNHELRTPLNAVIGFGQLLENKTEKVLTDEDVEHVGYIVKSGLYLLDLVNEILDLSQIESGRLIIEVKNIDCSDVVSECIDIIRPAAEKRNISIKWEAGNFERRLIKGDNKRFREVMLNLLSNAVKYNQESGEINVSCVQSGDSFICFEVMDNGPGITDERQAELFQPFNRLGAEYSDVEGTGMGLAITRKLVEFMGGTIDVNSESGVGTKFQVFMPISAEHV